MANIQRWVNARGPRSAQRTELAFARGRVDVAGPTAFLQAVYSPEWVDDFVLRQNGFVTKEAERIRAAARQRAQECVA